MKLNNINTFTLLFPALLLFLIIPLTGHVGPVEMRSECSVNMINEVSYSISSKTIASASQKEIIQSAIPANTNIKKGVLDICVDKEGLCVWSLREGNSRQHVLALEGMEEVIEVLKMAIDPGEKGLDDFIGIAKKKGAKIVWLGNGTCSVRYFDPRSEMTSVSLLDLSRNMLLGSSIYNVNNELQTKLICKYKNTGTRAVLGSTSLLYFQMDDSDSKLTLTEIVSNYN